MRTTDKLWIVLIFLCVFLLGTAVVKKLTIKALSSAERQSTISLMTEGKDDPKVFWEEEGCRREFENADYTLPENDFIENERTEFPENLEEEMDSISLKEALAILDEIAEWERSREK